MENKGLKHNDTELIILWQDNYLQMKHEEHAAKKEQRNKKNKEREVSFFTMLTYKIKKKTRTTFACNNAE